jgi:hypothetical protein
MLSMFTHIQPAPKYPRRIELLAERLNLPSLVQKTYEFLCEQGAAGVADAPTIDAALFNMLVSVYHSATATFYAPTDPSGIGGMRRETIRSTPSWRGKARRDTIFISNDPKLPGMRGLLLARALLFMRLEPSQGEPFPCVLVHWWEVIGNECDEDTGMWVAQPEFFGIQAEPHIQLVHLDTVLRASHLLPVHSADREHWVPARHDHTKTLDTWETYYINKWVDHNAYTIAF